MNTPLLLHQNLEEQTGRPVNLPLIVQTASLFFAGLIWLLIIQAGTKRSQLLQFLLGLSTGAHLNFISKNSKIQLLPVKAFRIEPDPTEQGYITVDGEQVEYGPIQAEIYPELGRVMVPWLKHSIMKVVIPLYSKPLFIPAVFQILWGEIRVWSLLIELE